ncbi:MAG: hypothetical protein O2989_06985 [Proteobacteria bacterium]|nr:hypothetical protein [Pseudomonadota bacterium]
MNKIVSIHPFKQEYASSFKSLNLEWIEVFFILEQEDIKILSNPEEYVLAKGGQIFFAVHDKKNHRNFSHDSLWPKNI